MKNISKISAYLFRRKTLAKYTSYFYQPRPLYNYSSTPALNPTLLKLQSGVSLSDVDATLQEISTFSSEDCRKALTLLLEAIQSQKSPLDILFNQKFIEQSLKHPDLFIDSKTFLVMVLSNELTELMMNAESDKQKIGQYLRIINQSYTECFQQLKKIEDEQMHLRYHIMLNKKYADFFVTYLSKYFPGEQKLPDFKRCTEVYRHHNQSIKQVLNQVKSKLQGKTANNQSLKFQALRMIQMFAENALFTNHIANEVYAITKNESELKESKAQICEDIKEGLEFYEIVKDIGYLSEVYIHLRKNLADISFYLQMNGVSEKDSQKAKAEISAILSQDYDRIFEQSLTNLEVQVSPQASPQKVGDICLSILNIRIQQFYNQAQLSQQELTQRITSQMKKVLQKIKEDAIRKECTEFLQQRVGYILHYEGVRRGKISDPEKQ